MSEKISDGRTIFTWSHPVVSSTVRYRYLRSSLQLKVKKGKKPNIIYHANSFDLEMSHQYR